MSKKDDLHRSGYTALIVQSTRSNNASVFFDYVEIVTFRYFGVTIIRKDLKLIYCRTKLHVDNGGLSENILKAVHTARLVV